MKRIPVKCIAIMDDYKMMRLNALVFMLSIHDRHDYFMLFAITGRYMAKHGEIIYNSIQYGISSYSYSEVL